MSDPRWYLVTFWHTTDGTETRRVVLAYTAEDALTQAGLAVWKWGYGGSPVHPFHRITRIDPCPNAPTSGENVL